MKVCPSCGSELSEDLSFCPSDGSPLLSKEETETESDIGEKTVVMGQDEFGEEETVAPERPGATEGSVGDATLVMSEPPFSGDQDDVPSSAPGGFVTEDIPSAPDDTMYSAPEDTGGADDTSEWGPPAAGPTDEWTEEPSSEYEEFEATAASSEEWEEEEEEEYEEPAAEAEEPAAAAPVGDDGGDEGKKRSVVGLIIGLVLLFFAFVIILAAVVGIWWYLSNRPAETADSNVEQNVNENLGTPEDDVPFEDTNVNLDDASNANADGSPDGSPANVNTRTTPTPRATRTPSPSPGRTVDITRATPDRRTTPTPARTPTPPRATPTPNIPSRVSRGVVNGQAVSLPQPAYPAAARAVNARGRVTVAVVIDRTGRVISASAVSGHPLLRASAVSAARRARFRPTLLSGQPVEVSGTIVYNFQ